MLALDGEKEFVQGISNANKEAQKFKSELKLLDSEYTGNANSAEYLGKKQEILANQLSAYTKKVDEADKGLKNVQSTLKAAGENYEKLKKLVEDTQEALEKMASGGKEGTKEYSEQEKALEKLQIALSDQGTE